MSSAFDEDLDPTETVTLDLALTLQALRRDGALERRFSLGVELGRGGMGTVRTGHDKHLGRTVAVKVMHDALADSAPLVSRFLLEAQLAAQLEHPNILPIYTLERDAHDRPALAMKLVQGQTYHDYLWLCAREAQKAPIRDGPYALPARIEPLIKISEALAYAHKRGVIHRDVKPANVMLAADGQVYLMDWGLARVQNDPRVEILVDITPLAPGEGHQTRPGQVIGTPAYMSPEQARAENATLTGAADQFSMGLTLYEALTLRVARSATDDAVARRQARDAVVPRASHRFGHELPPRLVAIVQKATKPRVEDRYPSMAHLAEDLRRVFTDAPLLAVEEPRLTRWMRAMADHPKRVLWSIITLASAAVIGGGLAVAGFADAQLRSADAAVQLAELQTSARAGANALAAPLSAVMRVLEASASTTTALLDDATPPAVGRPLADPFYSAADYPFVWNEAHRYRVTWDRPSYYFVPGTFGPATVHRMLQLTPLDTLLAQEVAWSVGEPRAGPAASVRLDAGESVIFRVYLVFADGLMAHYPGYAGAPPNGYDPRTRPAFVNAANTHGRRFRATYANWDTAAVLLPCTTALYDRDQRFVGVAGVDVSVDRLLAKVPRPEIRGWTTALLVDESGLVLGRATPTSPGFVSTAVDAQRVLGSVALTERLKANEPNGVVVDGESTLAFHRAEGVGWYYVIEATLTPP